ncbi:MAG: hypothetical protein ACLS54_09510 [Anaerostipes hadrus]
MDIRPLAEAVMETAGGYTKNMEKKTSAILQSCIAHGFFRNM